MTAPHSTVMLLIDASPLQHTRARLRLCARVLALATTFAAKAAAEQSIKLLRRELVATHGHLFDAPMRE